MKNSDEGLGPRGAVDALMGRETKSEG